MVVSQGHSQNLIIFFFLENTPQKSKTSAIPVLQQTRHKFQCLFSFSFFKQLNLIKGFAKWRH